MPLGSKRSRNTKERCQNVPVTFGKQAQRMRSGLATSVHPNAPATSAEDLPRMPSPEGSDYHVSHNSSDALVISVDNSGESEEESDIEMSVELLQHLYSVFLPPHLRLKEKAQEEFRRTKNRKAVYTRESRTTVWQWKTVQKRAAEGCTTLDTFVKRKVCS
jgi:hypothetical protein